MHFLSELPNILQWCENSRGSVQTDANLCQYVSILQSNYVKPGSYQDLSIGHRLPIPSVKPFQNHCEEYQGYSSVIH